MKTRRAKQQGLSLVELMVGLTVGLVVIGAGISLLTTTATSNTGTLRSTRANQDLRGALSFITHDLARAGHWGIADDVAQAARSTALEFAGTSGTVTVTAVDPRTGIANGAFAAPFTDANLENRTLVLLLGATGTPVRHDVTILKRVSDNELSVSLPATLPTSRVNHNSWTILSPFTDITVNADQDCVLLSYDLDDDGVLDDNERFGYRLSADGTGILQATTTATSCTAGTWEGFTDGNDLNVTAFSVVPLASNANVIATPALLNFTIRGFEVQITGQRRSDTTVVRSLRETVKVRNDRVV